MSSLMGFFLIGDGVSTRSWGNTWLGNASLQFQYPSSYNIAQQKNVSLHDVLSSAPPLNMSFKRALIGDKWDSWSHLCHRLMEVHLVDTTCLEANKQCSFHGQVYVCRLDEWTY